MKKSCERIAAVLGLRESSNDPMGGKRGSNPGSNPGATLSVHKGHDYHFNPVSEYGPPEPSNNATNMGKSGDGQPSGYKSLREKSPVRKSPVKGGTNATANNETAA